MSFNVFLTPEKFEQVLVATMAQGHRLELVRQADDGLAISIDGRPQYRWPATSIDSCVHVYLDLLRDNDSATPMMS